MRFNDEERAKFQEFDGYVTNLQEVLDHFEGVDPSEILIGGAHYGPEGLYDQGSDDDLCFYVRKPVEEL